jgi:hypothetical protein
MALRGAKELAWNCDNTTVLIEKYGPDYSSIRAKLGYVRGLFTD